MRNSEDCRVCRLVRFYLLLAVPLIAMLGLTINTAPGDSSTVIALTGVVLIDVLAYGATASLIGIVSFKIYQEYWLPRRRNKVLMQLTEDLED